MPGSRERCLSCGCKTPGTAPRLQVREDAPQYAIPRVQGYICRRCWDALKQAFSRMWKVNGKPNPSEAASTLASEEQLR